MKERRIRPHATPRPPKEARPPRPPQPNYYLAKKATGLRYDYAQVPEAHREQVQRAALDIKRRLKRTVEDMIEIGLRLNEVKQLLPGKFNDWIADEFSMSRRTAFEFRNVADRFADKSAIIALLSPTIVRLLAAPSVPDELASAVIELNQARLQDHMPALMVREVKEIKRQMTGSGNPPGRGAKQLPPPPSEPEIIEAEYTVMPKDEFIFPTRSLDPDHVAVAMHRDLAKKLQDALVNRIFRVVLNRAESDELRNAITRALEE